MNYEQKIELLLNKIEECDVKKQLLQHQLYKLRKEKQNHCNHKWIKFNFDSPFVCFYCDLYKYDLDKMNKK